MRCRTTSKQVQAITWTGKVFSEIPEWMPPQAPMVGFVMAPEGRLCCIPPRAWYGSEHGIVRMEPGDLLVYENEHIKVWKEEHFREVFITETE